MQPNVCTDEVQDQLSAFAHSLSLNANTNVRNTYFENIYTPGGGRLEKEGGGFPVECIWESGLERIRGRGVMSC